MWCQSYQNLIIKSKNQIINENKSQSYQTLIIKSKNQINENKSEKKGRKT